MLDPSGWLSLAQTLEVGQKAMHQHDCGEGKKLLVEHKEDGWGAWCYRCSEPGWVPHPPPSLAEKLARLKAKQVRDVVAKANVDPPGPMNFDASTWPKAAKLWLYKVGLSNPEIRKLGFYWNENMERVVLPVLDGLKVCYWQARTFDPDLPKYINPSVNPKPMYKIGEGPVLCLTEDILSAVKVGRVTEAWSLLGTSISASSAAEIAQKGKPVRIWLDPDGAGIKGRGKIVKDLRAYGVDARIIRANLDPKFYQTQQIKEYLDLT